MRGAKLTGVDLVRVNLSETDLGGANLRGANLGWATLFRANLSKAEMSGVSLSEANLSRADIAGANLHRANFSESDISGANLNNANLSQWIIKGIKCTHVFWKKKRIEFKEGDFEKAFTNIERTIEIILDIPFSEVGYHTGRIIEKAANQTYGEGTVLFKGQSAIANNTTKFDFISFGPEKEFVEIRAKLDNIPYEIEKRVTDLLDDGKAEAEDRRLIRFKDEVELPFTKGMVKVSTKEMARRMNERYMTMHPILQQVAMAVQSVFQ